MKVTVVEIPKTKVSVTVGRMLIFLTPTPTPAVVIIRAVGRRGFRPEFSPRLDTFADV